MKSSKATSKSKYGFNLKLYRIRMNKLIEALYTSLAYQCRQCGQRFPAHHQLKIHLDDFHFHHNEIKYRKEYTSKTTTQNRAFYLTRTEWVGPVFFDKAQREKNLAKSGKIRLYDFSSFKDMGMFDYDDIVLVDDVKSTYTA